MESTFKEKKEWLYHAYNANGKWKKKLKLHGSHVIVGRRLYILFSDVRTYVPILLVSGGDKNDNN